jgi:hypothetical protein
LRLLDGLRNSQTIYLSMICVFADTSRVSEFVKNSPRTRQNHRLFVGCRSKVMAVMNADTGAVIQTLPIGDHVDA